VRINVFIKCSRVNSDFSCVKTIEPINKFSLISVTKVLTSCRYVLQQWDIPLMIDICLRQHTHDTEDLILSQVGKPQTHSGKVCDLQHTSDLRLLSIICD